MIAIVRASSCMAAGSRPAWATAGSLCYPILFPLNDLLPSVKHGHINRVSKAHIFYAIHNLIHHSPHYVSYNRKGSHPEIHDQDGDDDDDDELFKKLEQEDYDDDQLSSIREQRMDELKRE